MGKGMAFVNLCIKEKFFTSGDNRQYNVCIDLAEDIGNVLEKMPADVMKTEILQLAAMTYICSDTHKFNYDYIADKVTSIF